MKLMLETIKNIGELNMDAMEEAGHRVNNLVKPPGSLGRIEDLAIQLAGITGNVFTKVDNKAVIVMAADHGVYDEGVAPNPQIITAIQTNNMAKGVTGVCAFAKQAGAKVIVVDVGVKNEVNYNGVINKKIRSGTSNMTQGPAMTREEAVRSIEIGIEITNEEIMKGANCIAIGEMGISNTTASSAIISVLGDCNPHDVVGIGAGLPVDKLHHKAEVIRRAINKNHPDANDPVDVLSKVGGFEIGGMVGTILAAAAQRKPIVIDGFISYAAALLAVALEPKIKSFIFVSHMSAEKGGVKALQLLGLDPLLNLGLRLGEGSGAVLAFNLLEAATYMVNEMVTLEESGIVL
ncbi:nicotinate-nucleotide--dimethylbenzimidazole phosphoribosyltransferase [Alkaliphilus peptidifermentans]|uniref:Nicotinate-nucleotide--dimethylbenzimidazole phosphoribosyltransferase n=1 Tax=Alkaliphilus peptidifermentans DSM 18978 TaxID=1120976 RepID=A0A1G5IFI8_9FIRM|nr:nicotinate-nucleotide--dimethylbenzimidazole phosphoribosyltransferase [Alkaliphilus peptidifermentans]SCY74329.1 nicotinate-nucleotide-dimethylbenzimidazole phosphoribosyltransferase [Alkaliphilus peptidifermentans DSM 18978]